MIIDMQSLLDLFDGDRDGAKQILEFFFDSAKEQVKEIREGIATANRNQVKVAAHQMAGATASCGMLGLSRQFRELESHSDTASPEALSAEICAILDVLHAGELEYASLFPEQDS